MTEGYASIGPRNFIRGNIDGDADNEARIAELQLGHGILSVETFSRFIITGKGIPLQLGHGILSVETLVTKAETVKQAASFNWATEFYPWKPSLMVTSEPLLFSFNWATEFYPWKLEGIASDSPVLVRFNWATEFYPWKPGGTGVTSIDAFLLQLGHGILSVETSLKSAVADTEIFASIGPRNFIRGNAQRPL